MTQAGEKAGKRHLGVMLLLLGIVILAVSLLADLIGIGWSGFGTGQIAGAVAGAVLAFVGWALSRRS